MGGRRRRVCIMCADKMKTIDYKNISFLRRFVSDRARIETRRKTSACAKHQRALARAIKRARHLAMLPYTAEHIRVSQGR
jgi:small subunit ribosomal protein S18